MSLLESSLWAGTQGAVDARRRCYEQTGTLALTVSPSYDEATREAKTSSRLYATLGECAAGGTSRPALRR